MDASKKLKIALDETRMLVMGAQILLGFQTRFGFQTRGAFEPVFEKLPVEAKSAHAISLMLTVVIVALLVAAASCHLVVMGGHFSPVMHTTGPRAKTDCEWMTHR